MATETEDRSTFRSNLRKEQNRSAGGTRDRRRVFEDSGGSGSTYSSSGVTSRYNRTTHHDRTESPSSASRTSSSISNQFNKLNVNDDCNDEREEKKECDDEEEEPSSRRLPKKTGGPSIANKINTKLDNDDEAEDEEEEKKEEEGHTAPKKQIKKAKATGTGNKRKERKHLREKRRSTGVVIMPGQPIAAGDEEGKQVQENTLKNMSDGATEGGAAASCSVSSADMEAAQAKSEQYIEDLKDELAKVHRELDTLRSANVRLKDENSALLRVVGSLSGTGH